MIPYTHRRIINKVAVDMKAEFDVYKSMQEYYKIYEDYIRTIVYTLEKGDKERPESFVSRVLMVGFGVISFRGNKLYRIINSRKDTIKVGYDKFYSAMRRVIESGWKHIGRIEGKGFLFYNEQEGISYLLTNSFVVSVQLAYVYFDKIKDTEFVKYGIVVCFYEDIKPFTFKWGAIREYTKAGEFVKEHENLIEAAKEYHIEKEYMLKLLVRNTDRENYFVFRENILTVNDSGDAIRTYNRTKPETYKEIYDIVDAKTSKVIHSRFGKLMDIKAYLNLVVDTTYVRTTHIISSIKQDTSLYGYKFKKSFIQVSKYEAEHYKKETRGRRRKKRE